MHCDYVCYGGETAKKDAEKFFEIQDLRCPNGKAIELGVDFNAKISLDIDKVKDRYGIRGEYILAVETVDAKKNYEVLYKAYVLLQNWNLLREVPTLVIVGKNDSLVMKSLIERTLFVRKKIHVIQASDEELNTLYKNCIFMALPSWYEGRSLTIQEAMNNGKFCLLSDVAPLREVAGDLAVYCAPDDPVAWARSIHNIYNDKEKCTELENRVKENWHRVTYAESARELYDYFCEIKEQERNGDENFCFDLSLTYRSLKLMQPVSGILRTELLLARYMGQIFPNMKYSVFSDGGCEYVSRSFLAPLQMSVSIDQAYDEMYAEFQSAKGNSSEENISNVEIVWMGISLLPRFIQKRLIYMAYRFKKIKGDDRKYPLIGFDQEMILLSVGSGFDEEIYRRMEMDKKRDNWKFVQLIYDFTPILYPQFHQLETPIWYKHFLEKSYKIADYILYGGKTAQRDGIAYAKKKGYREVPSKAIFFGSDKAESADFSKKEEERILERFGLDRPYILVVGTFEPRKNHETLYLAYLDMLGKYEDTPQMVFAGYSGWHTEELFARIARDERVRGQLIVATPTDDELAVLYRNCRFTVLASMYEGWSLTMPESLQYGKFCLCADNEPLREAGGDFADYVEGYDVKGWSERMYHYYSDEKALRKREKKIREQWHPITWRECAQSIADFLEEIQEEG